MHESGPFQGVGWRFSVRCSDPAIGAQVATVLIDLAATGDEPGAWYDLRPTADDGIGSLTCEGEVLCRGDASFLYATLLWHVNRGTVLHSADHVLLHASAAELDGRAVILSAPMESGKTTLVAGLVLSGLRYLTDEAVAIRPADLGISPYPKPLSIDRGSWPYLPTLRPSLPSHLDQLMQDQWQVPVSAIRPDAVAPTGLPAMIVLPRYELGAETRLTPLSRGHALSELMGNLFEPDRDRRRDVAVLAEVVRRSACYRLVTGDLDSAVTLVRDALDQ